MSIFFESLLKNKNFSFKNNIYTIKQKNDETADKVSDFYKQIPFPSYKKKDNKLSISNSGNNNKFYKNLKDFIGLNKNILEMGSGTSQLSMYLAIGTNNKISALDMTKESLELGRDFAYKNDINNITFVKADLLQDIFKNAVYDFVLSLGVLHHTKNTYKGFVKCTEVLKDEGYIVVGLYNSYGRKRLEIRRLISKIFGKKIIHMFDPLVRKFNENKEDNKDKIDAWIHDQYFHPVERTNTFDEVLQWFKLNNIKYISSVPTMDFKKNSGENIFLEENICSKGFRILKQLIMNFEDYGKEGGLFIMIGKKCK
jgi:ubiquinone/menaquinone biosynthesis C-methylase UbiE